MDTVRVKPFYEIAIPHEDVVAGRVEMDIYAADLWQVVKGKAPEVYQNADLFFAKTYMTEGLRSILNEVKDRFRGEGVDSVYELQTSFGGGKTHTLIALYHKARQWKVNIVVIDGTAFDATEVRLWEELERQLTGKVTLTKGMTSPGKEKLQSILAQHGPVLILIDELLTYIVKADGVNVGATTLAAQTYAFIQELTGAVSSMDNALLVVTLPSSNLEYFGDDASEAFDKLRKVVGRVKKNITPVSDNEIAAIIRKRLFKTIDEDQAAAIVEEFVEHAEAQGVLKSDMRSVYKEKFLESYPFKPEVIDVLYTQWGVIPTFQRTRGVLRLLSIVTHSMLKKQIPFIRLGDFPLKNETLRKELIEHIGSNWDSIIAKDITAHKLKTEDGKSDEERRISGAMKVDKLLGDSYEKHRLGTVVSTTIFMNSFPILKITGREPHHHTEEKIARYVLTKDLTKAVIENVLDHLKRELYYLSDEGYFFTTKATLNTVIRNEKENVQIRDVEARKRELIKAMVSGDHPILKTYLYPNNTRDIPDDPQFKLVVFDDLRAEFFIICGDRPRTYRNTMFFLCGSDIEKLEFEEYLKELIALEKIKGNNHWEFTEEQKERLKKMYREKRQIRYEKLRKFYRRLYVPEKGGQLKPLDLGIPSIGKDQRLDREIYGFLRSTHKILEKLTPIRIKERYLKSKDCVEVKKIYDSFLKTPGELRLASAKVFVDCIKEGVRDGLFGAGIFDEGKIRCKWYKQEPSIHLTEDEIIIRSDLCEKTINTIIDVDNDNNGGKITSIPKGPNHVQEPPIDVPPEKYFQKVYLHLGDVTGKFSDIHHIVTNLLEKFNKIKINVIIDASDGEIKYSEYQRSILDELHNRQITIIEHREE